jgi:tetratricopeptide (TPR) repeat protein
MAACADRRALCACLSLLLLAGCASKPASPAPAKPATAGSAAASATGSRPQMRLQAQPGATLSSTVQRPGATAAAVPPAPPGPGATRPRAAAASAHPAAASATKSGATPPAGKAASPSAAATAAAAASAAAAQQRFQSALDLMKKHQYPQAIPVLQQLSNAYPQMSGPPTNLGIIYAQQKNNDAAINAFTRAVTVNPGNAVAYDWLGVLYREKGDYPRAEQAYRKALAANGNDATAHYNLGLLYDIYLRRPQDALEQYRDYLKLSGGNDLKVQAWMRMLESTAPAQASSSAPAAGGAR